MPFYIARADSNGAKIAGTEVMLTFTPTKVDYPSEALGVLQETDDGNVIQQQANKDSRRRSWIWVNWRDEVVGWPDFWAMLEGLRSKTRISGGAPTPYAFVKEDMTGKLRLRSAATGQVSSATSNTLSSVQTWTTNQFAGFDVEIMAGTGAGQQMRVASNTATTLTITGTWSTLPDTTSVFEVRGFLYDWVRVRVLEVQRTQRDDGGPKRAYPESRFSFVIDDPAYNDIG